jgi:betaine-aldehyde dehydrogenase
MKEFRKLFIGGHWAEPSGAGTVDVISPATEEVVGRVPEVVPEDVDRAVAAAAESWQAGTWRTAPLEDRIAVMTRLADSLEARKDELAELVTLQVGSPITMSLGSQAAAFGLVRSFIDAVRTMTFEEMRTGPRGKALVRRVPVGVVANISPWNGPLYMDLMTIVPALLAGCSAVAKPAVETPLSGFVLAEAMGEAGLPAGVLSVLPADRAVGQHLVSHPGIVKVSFIGSTAAGRQIASTCGQQLKRVCLELGGKSAAIVLDDADLSVLIPALVVGSFYNTGQACNALTRLVVHRSRHDEVVDALLTAVKGLVVGDPFDPATQIGPLAMKRQLDRVLSYIDLGKSEGAVLACGGGQPANLDRGFYVEPTVFTGVRNDMRIAREEIFGPVLSVIAYDGGDDEAIAIANDSEYGLHGAVFTADHARAARVAAAVDSGTFTINGYVTNTAAPYGGVKGSGYGREHGVEGISEFLEYRTINDPLG